MRLEVELNFCAAVKVGLRSARPVRHQGARWNLRVWIDRTVVLGKSTDITYSCCPRCQLSVLRLLCPLEHAA